MIYKRHPEEIDGKKYSGIPYLSYYSNQIDVIWYKQTTIGFCGKLYSCFEVNTFDNRLADTKESRKTRKFCFDIEDIDHWVESNCKPSLVEAYHRKKYKSIWSSWNSRYGFLKHFDEFNKASNKFEHIFEEHRCPQFVTKIVDKKLKIVLNPLLKDFEFYRIFDPYQAYQEIAMFLGNFAEPRKNIPPISDEIMLEAKGFDKKFSFRKEKKK